MPKHTKPTTSQISTMTLIAFGWTLKRVFSVAWVQDGAAGAKITVAIPTVEALVRHGYVAADDRSDPRAETYYYALTDKGSGLLIDAARGKVSTNV